jgi:hypothetical protein
MTRVLFAFLIVLAALSLLTFIETMNKRAAARDARRATSCDAVAGQQLQDSTRHPDGTLICRYLVTSRVRG